LTSPEMGYGTDAVGYLAGFAAVSVLTTPRFGKWSDRIGPRSARLYLAVIQVSGTALLLPFGHSIWLLMIPILITSTVGPAIDVSTRMTFLSQEPALRTRLTTIYVVMMFIGGGAGSVLGTALFDAYGWNGTAIAVLLSCGVLTALCVLALRLYGSGKSPKSSD